MPARRFFPADAEVGRWLSSSRITVDPPAGTREAPALVVRVAAQLLADGRMEFALQERQDDGSWADRRLPDRRFFPPDARVGRWLSSSPLTVTVAGVVFSPCGDEVPRLATATIEFAVAPASADGAALVSIDPPIEGSFVWSDDRTLLFQPAFPGWQRGQRYVVRVDGRAAGLTRDFTHAFTVEGGLEVTYVIPGDGDREAPTEAQVLVQFSRSVAALTVLQEGDAPPVLEFDPPLAGKGEWLNTSLYRFVPTDLQPSTTYRVRIPAGLTSAADGVLGSDFTWSFETIQPAVASFEPANDTKWVEPDGPFVVTFNQPMDRASVEARGALRTVDGTPIAATFEWSEGDTVATLVPVEPLMPGGSYELVVPGGVAGAAGSVTASERVARFSVVELPRLVSTNPRDGETEAGTWSVWLNYNNPMDTDSFEGRVSITGIEPDAIYVWGYGEEVRIRVPLRASTSYTVRIAAGVRDRGGRTLPRTSFSFVTAARAPSLSLATSTSLTTISSNGPQRLHYHSARFEEVRFALYRLSDSDAETLLQRGYIDRYRWDDPFNPEGEPIREWTEAIGEALRDTSRLYSTALADGTPLPTGDYFLIASGVTADSGEDASRSSTDLVRKLVLSVVDTAIVTKKAHDELLVWALDHATGEPLDGVEVRAVRAQRRPSRDYQAATTDADGLARFPLTEWDDRAFGSPTYLVRIDANGRYGVASTAWDRGASRWELGVRASHYIPSLKGHTYTDRPIYRPGETVFFKAVLRDDDDATHSIPITSITWAFAPVSREYSVLIRDSEYNNIFYSRIEVGELGTLDGSFQLPADTPTGTYRLAVQPRSTNTNIAATTFTVADFRVPEFEVEVGTAVTDYVSGDSIAAEAATHFYFGAPVADAPVAWVAQSGPIAIRVEGYEGYSFTDYDVWTTRYRDSLRGRGEVRTDASGVAPFKVPAALDDDEGTQQFTISATVTDASAQAVSGSSTVTVHPAAWYAGIRPESYIARAEELLAVHLVTVDFERKIAPQRPVTVRIFERDWVRTKERTSGGGYRYRYEPVDTEIQVRTVTTDDAGEASFDFAPPSSGTYRLVAESTDSEGRVARSAYFLWVSGRDHRPWPVGDNDVIELQADREQYQVGDVAEVLVPAPFSAASALVTTERARVLSSDVRTFETNSEVLRIPIEDAHIPNVYVAVVLYRPPTEDDPFPRYAVGHVNLSVDTAPRRLEVRIEPDRERALAGETVAYEVTVTDAAGRGVAADVSVAVVDEAVLSLADEQARSGMEAFWHERPLSVRTASSLAVSVDRRNEAYEESANGDPGEGAPGSDADDDTDNMVAFAMDSGGVAAERAVAAPPVAGGADAGPAPRIRSDFRNTALWIGQLTTDADGTASFDLHLPDNTTTWRASARAVTADTLVGSGSSGLLATQPLIVRPASPRFLRVGDDVTLRTLVRNGTQLARVVTATVEVEGVTLDDDSARSATVEPGDSAIFEWPARAVAEGTATVRFSATATGGYGDAVEISLPVHLDVTPETTATGGVVEDVPAVEVVYLPDYVITGTGSLDVSLLGSLVGALDEELGYFKPYRLESNVRIASRVIATVAVQRASPDGLDAAQQPQLRKDLAELLEARYYSGGWGWSCRSCQPNDWVTGWVLIALGEAREAGHSMPRDVLDRAWEYIATRLNLATDVQHPANANQRALLLYALASASEHVEDTSALARAPAPLMVEIVEEHRASLTNWGRAYLVLGLLAAGENADHWAVRALLNDLTADTIASANGNHWEDERVAGSMHNGSVRITAIVLRALTEVDPRHPLIEETARWLALARSADRWKTTVERAQGMASLGAYAELTGETRGVYDYSVLVNTDEVLAGHFNVPGGDYLDATSVALADLPLGEVSRVQFERAAGEPGRLYYGLNLRYVTPAAGIEALNRGFAVSHRYSLLDDPDTAITSASVGAVVRVTVSVVAPADRLFVEVQDFLPAGLEPIDPQLRIVSPRLRQQLREDKAQALQSGASGYCAPWYGWCYSPWDQVDLRDERLVLQASRLAQGLHEYVYYARATTPGDFFVAPAHAQETYLPEVFGRGDSSRFTVW